MLISVIWCYYKFAVAGNEALIMLLIAITLLSTSATGFSTAFIMKKLDNIVKLYAQSITNMIIALICAFFFPEKFHIDAMFVVSIVLIFVAIFLYENDNVSFNCYDHNMNSKLYNSFPSRCVSPWLCVCSVYRVVTAFFVLALAALLVLYLMFNRYVSAKTISSS